MAILIGEDNVAQRRYLRELLEREFPAYGPVHEAIDGESTVSPGATAAAAVAGARHPDAGAVGSQGGARHLARLPRRRIIFWTQFPHGLYINEIRKLVKAVDPPPAYGFIHKNNLEARPAAASCRRCWRTGRT
jgi:hypothetical protein